MFSLTARIARAGPLRVAACPLHKNTLPSWTSARTLAPSLLPARTFVSSHSRLERAKGGQPDEGERKIIELLKTRFNPKQIQVADISGGCGSFYAITLTSKEFNGLSTIKQHRLVNQELKDIIADIHGLQLRTRGEEE
ncbi:hypothetical protein A4X13_0g422 [Tilletia indica]|uniref:Uncharacterized protein n=1 Tax=Tilletia indica TaxID=43049 RepID=A0A177TDE8_9BASI|nr:hypothetical protein A4X13_0g422 [Tilletia indica]